VNAASPLHSNEDLRSLLSTWWVGGPSYDERVTYLGNRSLLPMIRAVVSTCALLLGLMAFVMVPLHESLTWDAVVRLTAAGTVALFWAARWQIGEVPTARWAAIFVASAIVAIYAAASTLTDPVMGALVIASLAMIATFGALILSTRAFVVNAALIFVTIVASVLPIVPGHGWALSLLAGGLLAGGLLAGATIGVPATMQFGMSFSWFDTAEAGTDQLTTAFNRRGLSTIWSTWAMRRTPAAKHVGVIVLDLDGFKAINDAQGHTAGDQMLIQVARTLRSIGADVDALVSRLGGDEFALLVIGHRTQACLDLAQRIRLGVAAIPPIAGYRVTASIGVCVDDDPAADPSLLDRLLTAADGAMYQAKRTGDAVVVAPGTPRV
jgi:diguanylate cyclase (GGDEF)-like protein